VRRDAKRRNEHLKLNSRRRPWGNDNSPPAPPRPYSTRSRKETATYVSYLRRDLRAMRRCFDYEVGPLLDGRSACDTSFAV
jgi:hypothetical protein